MIGERVDFNSLPVETRRRLIGSLTGASPPRAILFESSLAFGLAGPIALLVLGGGAVAFFLVARLSDFWVLVGCAGGSFAATLGVTGLIRYGFASSALPSPPGLYLLPSGFIDARDRLPW